MKKNRLIPVLLLKDGWLVQSKNFSEYQNLGNPTTAVQRLSEWGSDELIYLDISRGGSYDLRRNDQCYPNRKSFLEIIEDVSKVTFMPITVGGKIDTLQDIEDRLRLGADKISVNSKAIQTPDFIASAARIFGSQCIVVSIDVKKENDGYFVYSWKTSASTHVTVKDFCKRAEDLGAGEIFLNSVDRDGRGNGYDLELLESVVNSVRVPVIACGGAGTWEHFRLALDEAGVDAVAAANVFHFRDQSTYLAKKYLFDQGLNVRRPDLIDL
jgi:cyclase